MTSSSKKSVTRKSSVVTEDSVNEKLNLLERLQQRFAWPKWVTWLLVAYLVLTGGMAYTVSLLHAEQEEVRKLQQFDLLRDYELCLQGNEARDDIRKGFLKFRDVLVSSSDTATDDPRLVRFDDDLKREVLDPLGPRDCVRPNLSELQS